MRAHRRQLTVFFSINSSGVPPISKAAIPHRGLCHLIAEPCCRSIYTCTHGHAARTCVPLCCHNWIYIHTAMLPQHTHDHAGTTYLRPCCHNIYTVMPPQHTYGHAVTTNTRLLPRHIYDHAATTYVRPCCQNMCTAMLPEHVWPQVDLLWLWK